MGQDEMGGAKFNERCRDMYERLRAIEQLSVVHTVKKRVLTQQLEVFMGSLTSGRGDLS